MYETSSGNFCFMLNLAILILLVWTGNVCEHLHQVQNMRNVHETCICLAACKIPQVCQVGFAGCVRNVRWVAFQPLPPPLNLPSASAWHRDSSPINSNARFNSFWFFAQMVHMSCPVWCTCQCAIVLQGSATTWNPRESPPGFELLPVCRTGLNPPHHLLSIVRLSKLLLLLNGCYTPSPDKCNRKLCFFITPCILSNTHMCIIQL